MKKLLVVIAIVACGLVAAYGLWRLSYVDVAFVVPRGWHGAFQVIVDAGAPSNKERSGSRVKIRVNERGEARVPNESYVTRQTSAVAYFDDDVLVDFDQLHFIGCQYDSRVGHDSYWWYIGNAQDAVLMKDTIGWQVGSVRPE